MAGAWRRDTEDLQAIFRVEGNLDSEGMESLSYELREAADAGFRDLVLDLEKSAEQSLHHWSAFRPVVEQMAKLGARLSVQGATPDLLDGLRYATIEAQMRLLDRQFPDFFSKVLL